MKNIIDWKLFFLLLSLSAVVCFMVMPYTFALSPNLAELFTPKVIVLQIIQNLVLFSLAIFLGLLLSKPMGFVMPVLQGMVDGKRQTAYLKSILPASVGFGAAAGVLIILLSLPFASVSLDLLGVETRVAAWKALFASFYGGIAEEILMRLFLVSLFAWIIWFIAGKIKKTKAPPGKFAIWFSIILTSIIFGLGHLPITGELTAITPEIVIRAIVLNGAGGVVFGWLYWKKGLESAMIAHFTADIVLHIITPNVSKLFM
jgi:membrane protease YdiL (CAAX protease family)